MNCNNPLSLKILISNTHRTTFTGKPDYNEDEIELSKYGCWNPEFARMNLPSFRAAYLFLARVPRNVPFCLVSTENVFCFKNFKIPPIRDKTIADYLMYIPNDDTLVNFDWLIY